MLDESDRKPVGDNDNSNPFAKYSSYMVLIIIICVVWIIALQSENSDLKDDLETANEEIAEMDDEIFQLQEQNSIWEIKVEELTENNEKLDLNYTASLNKNNNLNSAIQWFNINVAICTPTGSKYHTYDCYYWKDSEYVYIYSVGEALSRGYEPCSYCQ